MTLFRAADYLRRMETIFDKALALCDGNKRELARRCKVTAQTIYNWQAEITPRAELTLEKLLRESASATTDRSQLSASA